LSVRSCVALAMLIGVDEAGRGPLAGPVCAAAVALGDAKIAGLVDSKKLSAKKREGLALQIRDQAQGWGVGWASVEEIDSLNILKATFLAMSRAVEQCLQSLGPQQAVLIQVDGSLSPARFEGPWHWPYETEAVVKGDEKIAEISAASILAKTARDREMAMLHQAYPDYGFDRHAGYGTAFHLEAIRVYGVTPVHRKSFSPIAQRLVQQ
jgi:ribonuclease HII